jgi:hypothetical protein
MFGKMKTTTSIWYIQPPQNNPALSLLDVTKRTLVVGDFNAHFHEVGYKNINEEGKTMEDFILANNVELLYEKKDTPTYLHYNGSTTNPDLTLASPDTAALASRNIINDPGCGHRMIITTVNFRTTPRTFSNNTHYVQGFKKAKWHKYRKELGSKISEVQFEFQSEAPYKNYEKLCNLILCTAKQCIPKGKIPKYKPFWSALLTRLKNEREIARKKAEILKEPKDV